MYSRITSEIEIYYGKIHPTFLYSDFNDKKIREQEYGVTFNVENSPIFMAQKDVSFILMRFIKKIKVYVK